MNRIVIYNLLFVFSACEEKDNFDEFLPSNTVGIDVDEVTIFDTSFPVNFSTSNTNVDEILVTGGNVKDRAVSISDKSGSTTFTDADFGDAWAIEEGVSFTTLIDFGSNLSEDGFSISVVTALNAKSSVSKMMEYDSTKVYFSSTTATMFSNMEDIMVEVAVKNADTSDPVFEELDAATASMEFEHIDSIMGVDFTIGDTINYKITASGNGYEEMKMVEVAVVSKSLPTTSSDMISSSAAEFAFMPVEDADDAGVMNFVTPTGFSSSDVMFVEIEEGNQVEEFAKLNEFSILVGVVDEATLVSSVTDVMIGKVYAFKYTYMVWDYYGYIVIDDVHSTAIGDAEDGFSFTQDVKY